jgi:nucleoside-diphosphate-sugar epimerase
MNILASAHRLGLTPCVQLLTTTFFDMWKESLTEHSPLDLNALNIDPYSLSKRFAFLEGDARARAGQDVRFVIPGGCYGPSPALSRAMILPSFDALLVWAIKGDIKEIIDFPIPWSFVDDVAWVSIAAMERGTRGDRYIAQGLSQETSGLSTFLNTALDVAGVKHRIQPVPKDKLDDPAIREKYGDSLTDLGKTSFPEPWFDNSFTQKTLGYKPTPIREGLTVTVDWLRKVKLV